MANFEGIYLCLLFAAVCTSGATSTTTTPSSTLTTTSLSGVSATNKTKCYPCYHNGSASVNHETTGDLSAYTSTCGASVLAGIQSLSTNVNINFSDVYSAIALTDCILAAIHLAHQNKTAYFTGNNTSINLCVSTLPVHYRDFHHFTPGGARFAAAIVVLLVFLSSRRRKRT
uniref:Minor glycoprotein n=1 Tax=Kibale red colobus virus 2 TaxID=1936072 RepID=X2D5D9_9NIDO|nr:minor glycoprotein [Kibale red colobus virus 2]